MNAAGDIVYSLYTSGGYKLYRLPAPAPVPQDGPQYLQPAIKLPPGPAPVLASAGATPQFDWADLRTYDDSKLPDLQSRPYKSDFLGLSVVPFLRVDNYNAKATGLELIKAGAYLFSNELLDKTGFFAGAALNVLLERDLFLQFFYRGQLPLLYQLGLEPVASLELYNVTRKTDNYISLPASTIPVDVTYNLLEFDAVLNQRALSQFSNVELRYAHSRYTSIIDNFINPETNSLMTGSSDLYLIANTLMLTFSLDNILPSRTDAINPVGRKILLRVGQEWNLFNGDGEYEVTSTGLQPVYKDVDFQRIEMQWREHLPLFFRSHTLTATLRAGTIVGPAVDEFFDFYAVGAARDEGISVLRHGGERDADVRPGVPVPVDQLHRSADRRSSISTSSTCRSTATSEMPGPIRVPRSRTTRPTSAHSCAWSRSRSTRTRRGYSSMPPTGSRSSTGSCRHRTSR